MSERLVDIAERDPALAQATFEHVEEALNRVLPSSNVHERYRNGEPVGLALVIAPDVYEPDVYNPLDPTTPDRVTFMTDNRNAANAKAWESQPTDAEVLQGDIPEGMGRFTAFALAKINALGASTARSSFRADTISVAPGQVGYAGGRRIGRSLQAASGLWEVHDDVTNQLYAHELVLASEPATAPRTTDNIAETMEELFTRIHSLHDGAEAKDLSRRQVADLLIEADRLVFESIRRQK